MNDLQNLNLIELLPTSIASDETIRNICNAIAEKLQTINEKAELVLLLPRLDQLPETLVDELAWQYHVDFYDYAADINKKRALVRKAIDWHRRKGTPAAVEEVCTAVFKSAKVYENWEYGGEPYHFQVRMISEGIPDKSVLDNLYRAIKESKNVRSWLDALSFDRQIAGRRPAPSCCTGPAGRRHSAPPRGRRSSRRCRAWSPRRADQPRPWPMP